jgi:hypothetical protein
MPVLLLKSYWLKSFSEAAGVVMQEIPKLANRNMKELHIVLEMLQFVYTSSFQRPIYVTFSGFRTSFLDDTCGVHKNQRN